MFPSDDVNESKMSTTEVDFATPIAATVVTMSTRQETKDSGRVRIGAGMMRFDIKDSGRVRVGAGMMRF